MRTRCKSRRNLQRARRGTAVYLTVLSTALIVSLLGLAGLSIVRIERRQMAVDTDRRAARVNANSAIELALRAIANDPNWRTTYSNGVETAPQSLGSNATGTLSWILEDTDTSLTDADTDLRLKGVGRVGKTVQVSSVRLEMQFQLADYLRCPIHTSERLTLTETCTASGGPFSSNTDILELTGNTFIGNAEAPAFMGDQTKLAGTFTTYGAKQMPPTNPIDTIYKPMATEILWTDLPVQGQFHQLTGTLSATANPFNGLLNPNGVYFIRIPALGQLKFSSFSLYGTLVFEVEDKGKIKCDKIDHMQPHAPNYPILLVKALGTQFACDLIGNSGSTHQGLIHVIGAPDSQVLIGQNFNFKGTIVVEGQAIVGSKLSSPVLTSDPMLRSNPPIGYASEGKIGPVPGSWIWDALPSP